MNPLDLILKFFGGGLSLFGSGINLVRNIPFLWKLIANYSLVKELLTKAWGIIDSARVNGGLPTVEQTSDLIHIARIIFEKELIDLPELDELRFAEELRELENNLRKSIEAGRIKKGIAK